MQFDWRPGIGDPTLTGWLTVVAYFAAAVLSFRAVGLAQLSGQHWQKETMFWTLLTLVMVALGINKQLDLQTLVTELARSWAKNSGWYGQRRGLQVAFIASLCTGTVAFALLLGNLLRKTSSEVRVAALAMCLVMGFVVIRAASFHHVDALISRNFLGISWNAVLELPGICAIALSALLYARRSRIRVNRTNRERIKH